jgi:hypothetical protein
MDRRDEKRDRDEPSRVGDTLGLGDAVVPKSPDDPTASNEPTSVRRRRERMSGDDDGGSNTETRDREHSGATGIDMGSGGEGTDISGR